MKHHYRHDRIWERASWRYPSHHFRITPSRQRAEANPLREGVMRDPQALDDLHTIANRTVTDTTAMGTRSLGGDDPSHHQDHPIQIAKWALKQIRVYVNLGNTEILCEIMRDPQALDDLHTIANRTNDERTHH